MQTVTVYGIKNCNTMKKCFEYLDEKKVAYAFFDYKKDTPSEAVLSSWLEAFGEKVINKQGLTYKKLDDE
ncbi:MAG: arsenate reductase, partial [Moraxella sp.]|nr:arsenate reductase [Moraxella sp.]